MNDGEYNNSELHDSELTKETVSENLLESTVARLEKELADAQQKYFVLSADIDNMRKRAFKEYESIRTDAASRILKPLLDIVDDFDRALESESIDKNGLLLIQKSFEKLLSQNNVTVMNVKSEFDPEKHEAVMHVPGNGLQSGEIVQTLQKGYLINGKVLRHARVSIAE